MGIGRIFKKLPGNPFKFQGPPTPAAWQHAVFRGEIGAVRSMLKRGANINQEDSAGWTALDWAVVRNDEKMVTVLLENGAVVDKLAQALLVVPPTNTELAEMVKAHVPPAGKEATALTPHLPTSELDDALTAAVKSGNCERARELFDRAFWDNHKIVPGWDHLKIALLREDKPMMRLLVTWGAKAPDSPEQLAGIPADKYARYARILRECGMNAAVVEAAAVAAKTAAPAPVQKVPVAVEDPVQKSLEGLIRSLPTEEWWQVLAAVQNIGAPEAVIAGGALRDKLNGRPVKDVDIFLKTRGDKKQNKQFLERAFAVAGLGIVPTKIAGYRNGYFERGTTENISDPVVTTMKTSLLTKKKISESWIIMAGPQNTEYNIIFVEGGQAQAPPAVFAERLIKDFDFGFCQIAYNGHGLTTTAAFQRDVTNKQIMLNEGKTAAPGHLERLCKKYPDWEVCPESGDLLKPGDVAIDGSIYLGCHKGRDWYVTAKDAPDTYFSSNDLSGDDQLSTFFNRAVDLTKHLRAHGHHDWALPDKDILAAMYEARRAGAFKGTYNEGVRKNYGHWGSHSILGDWYISSSVPPAPPDRVWEKMFTDGSQLTQPQNSQAAVRCVRSVSPWPAPPPHKKTPTDTGPR
ncbi:MAG: hypothetical protein HY052_03375 [Proteobacteria bacterium]|nr:hypothetical protein [Pseudomonadota bacterium]